MKKKEFYSVEQRNIKGEVGQESKRDYTFEDWVDFVYDIIGGMMFGRISSKEGNELLDSEEAFEEWRVSQDRKEC